MRSAAPPTAKLDDLKARLDALLARAEPPPAAASRSAALDSTLKALEGRLDEARARAAASRSVKPRAPAPEASDAELESIYGPLGRPVAVYAHIHRPFIREIPTMIVVNTGSVSLSYDGDRRAAYLLLDDATPVIRRVEYDVESEIESLASCDFPHAEWIANDLRRASVSIP